MSGPNETLQGCALLVIDLQHDFCEGGRLPVQGGRAIIPRINQLVELFPLVIASQDWHPADHVSFAASHPGQKEFTDILLPGGSQTLWPTHCVAGSKGADFATGFRQEAAALVLRKGRRRNCDSYSAFFDNDRQQSNGLHGYLQELGIARLYLCGLALDFCVWFSALDAHRLGYQVCILRQATAAVFPHCEAKLRQQAGELGIEFCDRFP